MTEITANIEPLEKVKPIAFVAALFLAPLVFTAPFFMVFALAKAVDGPGLLAVLYIPVIALMLGAIPYLVFGTPTFIYAIRRGIGLGGAGFMANVMAAPVIFLGTAITNNVGGAGAFTMFMLMFGTIFAPAWGATFGWLYRKFIRI